MSKVSELVGRRVGFVAFGAFVAFSELRYWNGITRSSLVAMECLFWTESRFYLPALLITI